MYDLIIIGQDISTAVAALAAARRGLKTILIREEASQTCLREGGYAFPADTSPITGLGLGQPLEELFAEWDLSLAEAPGLVQMDPAFQVILPDHRVDLFRDRERLIADLIR
ncbi:MAG: hypothetical protein FWE89_04820, partial [Syntrophaceae bacterium]|nr:hypothetical protein [Syntrophaceae bacterium]